MRFLERYGCALLYLGLLTVIETAMIDVLVLPFNSTRTDWLLTTLLLAPYAAAVAMLFGVMLPARIAADVIAIVRRAARN